MPRYKLKVQCLFVDAKELDGTRRQPQDLLFAHVLDARQTPAKVLKFNDTAGFIARFILLGVEIGLIPEIIHSEFGDQVTDPLGEVQAVLKMLRLYVDERRPEDRMKHETPSSEDHGTHGGKYDLDFRVNFYATTGVSKIPIG
jgi:hypothetical protein